MNLLDLYVKIVFDSSDYDRGVDKAQKSNQSLSRSFGGVKVSAETIKNTIGVLANQYDAAKKNVEEITKKFNESAAKTGVASDETKNLSDKLRAAMEQLRRAKEELDEYNDGLSDTSKKSDEAKNGTDKFASALKTGFIGTLKAGIAGLSALVIGIASLTTASVKGYSEYEQLVGGAAKIFDQMDQSQILADAQNAYKNLGMTVSQYLTMANDAGANFAATMGDEAGYAAMQRGLTAIADYSSGTGKNLDELMGKFTLITRSASSYQSIADQFSGILPATSEAFLKQAQAAGLLGEKYKSLTDVPLAEYQEAVTMMLEQGVEQLNLTGNAAAEAFNTISGSIAMAKAAWGNLVIGLSDDTADMNQLIDNFVVSVTAVADNAMPRVATAIGGVANLVGSVLPMAIEQIPPLVVQILPQLADAASGMVMALISGIENGQGDLVGVVMSVAMQIVSLVFSAAPKLLTVGVSLITELVNGLASAAPELIPAAVAAVLQLVEGLTNPDSFSALIDGAIALIMGLTDGLIGSLPLLLESAPTIIENLVTALIENLPKLALAGLDFMIALAMGVIENLPEIASAAWQIITKLAGSLDDYLYKLGEWGEDAIDKIYTSIQEAWGKLVDAGSEIIGKIRSGLESGWEDLKSWFSDAWDAVFGNLVANVTVVGGETIIRPNSRNAGGLDYVPFNGYLSELHRGEMVLTAGEAEDYRRGNRGGYGNTFNLYVQSEPKTAADIMEAARYEYERAVLMGMAPA